MRVIFRPAGAAILLLAGAVAAFAQQAEPEKIPFAGGEVTITETEDLDKILAFNGTEIARNYVVYYDRTVEVSGLPVALFAVGDGGNACGVATVMIWKPDGEDIKHDMVGEDCGAPPAAVTPDAIYFVPYMAPGASQLVEMWTPRDGVRVAGLMNFAPQPATGWVDLDIAKLDNISDALDNAEVYQDAQDLLGDDLSEVITGLFVGGGTEQTASGIAYASGCTPHACGVADSFMAIDQAGRKLYFGHQQESGPKAWPALEQWPADVAELMKQALAGQ